MNRHASPIIFLAYQINYYIRVKEYACIVSLCYT